MQMCAVVELAALRMRLEVRHQLCQLHGLNMVQPELLKARRVDECGLPGAIHPVERGAGRCVFA